MIHQAADRAKHVVLMVFGRAGAAVTAGIRD